MAKNYLIFKKRPYLAALLLLLCSFIGINKAKADHFAAADLSIRYIGVIDPCNIKPDYTYQVTMTIYTDCAGILLGTTDQIQYESINGGAATTAKGIPLQCVDANGNPVPPTYTGTVVSSLCPAFANQSSCFAANKYPGYKQWKFVGTVTLPSAQTDWRFFYGSCCRNQAVINMEYEGFSIQAGINNVARYDVSTPEFTNFPLPYICAGLPFKYLNGPFDPDRNPIGQYMRVFNRNPTNQGFTNVAYKFNSPYTLANPVNSPTGYTVNPVSGTAEFVVPNAGVYGLAFGLDKFASNDIKDPNDDTRIAWTQRDVQVAVFPCKEPPPNFETQNNGAPLNIKNGTFKSLTDKDSAIYVCPGSKLEFDLEARNDNQARQNDLRWQSNNLQSCAGSVFTKVTNGKDTIKAKFSWTPAAKDLGDHVLIISAIDSSCDPDLPFALPSPSIYVIRVTNGLDAGPDLPTCQNNEKSYQILVRGTEYKLRVLWSRLDGAPIKNNIDDSTSIAPYLRAKGTTAFVVTTPDLAGSCKVKDTVQLMVDPDNSLNAFPGDANNNFVLCRPDYLQLDAVFTGKSPLTNKFGENGKSCGILDPITDKKKADSASIYGSFAFISKSMYDTLGANSVGLPTLVRTQKQQFLLTRTEMTRYGFVPSTITDLAIFIGRNTADDHEYSNFSISIKCTDKKELKKSDGFEQGMQLVYLATKPVTFPEGLNKFKLDKPYNWDSTKNLIIELCYHNNATVEVCDPNNGPDTTVIRYVPTEYVSGLVFYPQKNDVNNNRIPDPDALDVCPTTTDLEISERLSRPYFKFYYNEVPSILEDAQGGSGTSAPPFYWTPGQFLSDSSIQAPLAYVSKTTQYVVSTRARNGCVLYDTVKIYVPEHDYKLTGDTTVCFGEQALQSVNSGFAFTWHEYKDGKFLDASNSVNCVQCKDVILTPKATTTYKVVVYDSVWCQDTVTATVTVLPLPDVHILTSDTVIKYGQSIQLLASGARMFNWMPATGLSNANTSYPIATPKESTQYVLGGIGSNGCKAYDTVNVSIDNRDNLFIASGFSPNGDGKNDLFRVANLTFQRIVEFRVFNRWGQEVYNNNSNSGWDGTWKGVPQDIGNYSYQIRIGFPDGYVESYKGEVTLVR